jgi:CCR4-NOT transcription complex subunit 7/8
MSREKCLILVTRGSSTSISTKSVFILLTTKYRNDKIQNDAKNMLKAAGINFNKLKGLGIQHEMFSDYFTGSDMPYNEDIKWIVFHGGFDFGYLVEMLHYAGLPEKSEDFMGLLRLYFPTIMDLKFQIKDSQQLKDVGLSRLADKLSVDFCNQIYYSFS